jgi:hypothetical protein
MQALSDEQRIEILEKKVDEGFAGMDQSLSEIREDSREMRQDMREIRGQFADWSRATLAMWLTIIFGFAGIIIAMLAHT